MKLSLAITSAGLLLASSGHAELAPQVQAEVTQDAFQAAAPTVHSSCGGHNIPRWLTNTQKFASSASSRLNSLAAMSDTKRQAAWNSSHEKRWFGTYSKSRFNNVRKRMSSMSRILASSRLDVVCKWGKSYYGFASPGLYKITLGGEWKRASSGNADKAQTFVHEAAHIAGAVLGGEARGRYGVRDARTRAAKHPGTAIRTAENLGYYAICRSSYWNGKGGCP